MGQIFDRAFRVAKSYLNDEPSSVNYNELSEDDELKRIIDELNNDNKNKKAKQERTNQQGQKTNNANSGNPKSLNNLEEAYKVLEVNSSASNDEIKSAYKQKIKEYHPDRLETFGEELKKLAQTKTQEINKAYNLIKEKRGL